MKLNIKALAEVEIGFPILAEGLYHVKVEKVEVKVNKRQTGNNLVVQVKILDNPLTLHKGGNPIENKGRLTLTRYISLEPTPDYDPDENLKALALAIKLPPEADLNTEDLEGKLMMAKLTYKQAEKDPQTGKEYPEGNDISRFTPIPESDTFQVPPFG